MEKRGLIVYQIRLSHWKAKIPNCSPKAKIRRPPESWKVKSGISNTRMVGTTIEGWSGCLEWIFIADYTIHVLVCTAFDI